MYFDRRIYANFLGPYTSDVEFICHEINVINIFMQNQQYSMCVYIHFNNVISAIAFIWKKTYVSSCVNIRNWVDFFLFFFLWLLWCGGGHHLWLYIHTVNIPHNNFAYIAYVVNGAGKMIFQCRWICMFPAYLCIYRYTHRCYKVIEYKCFISIGAISICFTK